MASDGSGALGTIMNESGIAAQKIKENRFAIDEDTAENMLVYVADYFGHAHESFLATNVRMW